MQSDVKAWSQKWKNNEELKAKKHAAFSRLPRDQREAAFQLVKERQGGDAVVRIEDLIKAHEELAGEA
jgi:transcription initiation factor TFIIIB Brf1 subunit/transcription initiation factor TFIIB